MLLGQFWDNGIYHVLKFTVHNVTQKVTQLSHRQCVLSLIPLYTNMCTVSEVYLKSVLTLLTTFGYGKISQHFTLN